MPRDRRSKSKSQDVDSFISAGGSAPAEKEGSNDEMKSFTTRFPKRLVDQIDDAIDQQIVSESRNQWLMKAAVEKLEREQ